MNRLFSYLAVLLMLLVGCSCSFPRQLPQQSLFDSRRPAHPQGAVSNVSWRYTQLPRNLGIKAAATVVFPRFSLEGDKMT